MAILSESGDFVILLDVHKTLHAFDLRVHTTLILGECVAIFGASGAGKSTLLRLLAGLTQPDAGRIEVNGVCWFDAARAIHLPPQQRGIGFVGQDYALFPHMTVLEHLHYAASRTVPRARLDELLHQTELTALHARKPPQLSGGQQQRLALARALACEPQLLLLDEALSAQDSGTRARLQQFLAHEFTRRSFTCILVSHHLPEVLRLTPRVLTLVQGRVHGDGSSAQCLLTPTDPGQLRLQGEVLAVRHCWLSLWVAGEVVEVPVDSEHVATLREGDRVTVLLQATSVLRHD